jgi:hypothetical protein
MEKPKKNNYLIIFANNKFFLEKLKIWKNKKNR